MWYDYEKEDYLIVHYFTIYYICAICVYFFFFAADFCVFLKMIWDIYLNGFVIDCYWQDDAFEWLMMVMVFTCPI